MTDNAVTDNDLRNARLWAKRVDPPHTNPGYSGTPRDIYNAARVILDTVPAPPATLADELRVMLEKRDAGEVTSFAVLLARVEAVEKERDDWSLCADSEHKLHLEALERNKALLSERDEARASLKRESEARSQWMEFYRKAEDEVRDLTAEVERLTATFKETLKEPGHLPEPADVPDGEAWLVDVNGIRNVGVRVDGYKRKPWLISHPTGDWGFHKDSEIALVSKLVPEVSEWDA